MKQTIKTILIFMLLTALAACQPAAQPPQATTGAQEAATPAASATTASLPDTTGANPPSADPTAAPTQAPATNEGYPAPGDAAGEVAQPTQPVTNEGYPPPAAGVPAMENLSIVKATLVERGSDPAAPGFDRLTVTVVESAAAPGMTSRTDDLIGAQVYLFAEPAALPDLQPGDTFTAEVAYRGDESSGRFYATKIEKQ